MVCFTLYSYFSCICLMCICSLFSSLYLTFMSKKKEIYLSSLLWVVGVTKTIHAMPLSTMLFLHGWSFRLKCHCCCSFSLMFLLNFTQLTCSVHKIWIILTAFTRPPCVSTCTCDCMHQQTWHVYTCWLWAHLWCLQALAKGIFMMAIRTSLYVLKVYRVICIKVTYNKYGA